jgi:putative ABC transport system permease protein
MLSQDLRQSARLLRHRPGFSAVIIATLGLGIGANTLIFSAVNGVLLRPLPYRDPDRLVLTWSRFESLGLDQSWLSGPEVADLLEQGDFLGGVAAVVPETVNLSGDGEPVQLQGARVTASLFGVLGVEPILGRALLPMEDQPGAPRAVVLGQALWKSRFGGSRAVLGERLVLDGESYSVVGVMPPEFGRLPIAADFPQQVAVWLPLGLDLKHADREDWYLRVVGRLRDGVGIERARRQLQTIQARLERTYPATYQEEGWDLYLVSFHEHVVRDIRPALLALFGAVCLVLLIACANIANLLIVRLVSREREMFLRLSLGATRLRLVRHSLTENALLMALGGVAGFLLAAWGLRLLVRLSPGNIPRLEAVRLDGTVLVFTALATALCALLLGIAPALYAARASLQGGLTEGGRTTGLRSRRAANALVVVEVALSFVLLVGAGLMIKSFLLLQHVDPGFDPENVLTMRLTLPEGRYAEPERRAAFFRTLTARLQALPAVSSAAAVSHLPFGGTYSSGTTQFEGYDELEVLTELRSVTPDYFRTLGIPLVRGRSFTWRDDAAAPKVAIIDAGLARKVWPNQNPIGKKLRRFGEREVVGIVGAVKHAGLNAEEKEQVYFPYAERSLSDMFLCLKTASDPRPLVEAVRRETLAIDPAQPIADVQLLSDRVRASMAQARFNTVLLAFFSVLAVVLASLGLYGLLSYSVSQRRQEIGVRMALGAEPREVRRLVVGQALRLSGLGLALGLLAAFTLTPLLSNLLYGISARDPLTFVGTPLLLAFVALLAAYLPTRRALRVDPVVSLREQ